MPAEFRKKLQRLTYLEFQGHDRHEGIRPELSDDELLSELRRIPRPELYLGRYSEDDIKDLLERHGIMARLRQMGFAALKVEVRTDEVYTHRLYIYFDKLDYDHVLVELRLREGVFRPRRRLLPDCELGPLSLLMVDWLMLQNPARAFDQERPALPRQRYPGLGLLKDLIPLIVEAARETGRAGILDTPEHYHGALFYSRWFRFLNPEMEGKFLAMQRDLASLPLHTITRCIDNDCLRNPAAGPYEQWKPGEQILPIADALVQYFHSKKYAEIRDRAFLDARYDLDLEKCGRKSENEQSPEMKKDSGVTI